MDKDKLKTRHKIKELCSVEDLKNLLDATLLTDDEREIIWKVYRDGKSLDLVADEMGLSRATVSRKRSRALHKIGKMFV